MRKLKTSATDIEFNQKKVNHLFHYLDNFEILLKILKNGFAPSYCKELIDNKEYYIPMISFCNIPLKDVDLYMRYGKYGIGLSLDWALRNSISPVIYTHHTTPFKNLHSKINEIQIHNLINEMIGDKIEEKLNNKPNDNDYEKFEEMIKKINQVTIPTIQFFKNWKTTYRDQEIITYQEREWRYVPSLINKKRIITDQDDEFDLLEKKSFGEKPHFPNHILPINQIENLRYVIVKNDNQAKRVINLLDRKFGSNTVTKSIREGKLMVIKHDLIFNDF